MVRGEACRRAPGHADRTHPPPWPPSTCSAVRGVDRDPRARAPLRSRPVLYRRAVWCRRSRAEALRPA